MVLKLRGFHGSVNARVMSRGGEPGMRAGRRGRDRNAGEVAVLATLAA